jgi:acyl transferase domain-containing protein
MGSLKSNIGHSVAAAGVAGVIKSVMALRAGVLPKSLHIQTPTPHVDWTSGTVKLLTATIPWPDLGRPRRAAVSAFGMSGSNAHAILEQVPPEPVTAGTVDWTELPFTLSGATDEALRAQAARLEQFVAARPDIDPRDLGWSLATTRASLRHRAVVHAQSHAELVAALQALAADEPLPTVVRSQGSGMPDERTDWRAVFGPRARRINLPTYAFQHQRFWIESERPRTEVQFAVAPIPPPPVEDTAEYPENLLDHIREETARLLGLPFDEVEPELGFFQLGVDSMLAVQLRGRLETTFGRPLSTMLLFDHPTPAQLARYLAESPAPTAPHALIEPDPGTQPDTGAEPSEEQLLRLLSGEIAASHAVRTDEMIAS